MMEYYAHSLEGRPTEEWQPLEEHLHNVAKLAAEFARPFGGEEWAKLAGLWHDLGKYSNEFQRKLFEANSIECHLETKPGKVIHSQAGGHLAALKGWRGADRVLSWLIMGHHAGLADFATDRTGAKALEPKTRAPDMSAAALENVPEAITAAGRPVVATSIGGIPEIVADGTTGLLYPPGEVDLLVKHVEQLAADPGLRRRMGEAGRAKALHLYTGDAVYDALEVAFGMAVEFAAGRRHRPETRI